MCSLANAATPCGVSSVPSNEHQETHPCPPRSRVQNTCDDLWKSSAGLASHSCRWAGSRWKRFPMLPPPAQRPLSHVPGEWGERKAQSSLNSQKDHLRQHTPIFSCTNNRLQILPYPRLTSPTPGATSGFTLGSTPRQPPHPRANKFQSKTYHTNSPATLKHSPEL